MHWSHWTGKARGAVLTLIWNERLSWSILHGLLTLRISSSRAFQPRGNEILSSLEDLLQCEDQTRSCLDTHTHTQHAADLALRYLWRPQSQFSQSITVPTYSTKPPQLILILSFIPFCEMGMDFEHSFYSAEMVLRNENCTVEDTGAALLVTRFDLGQPD